MYCAGLHTAHKNTKGSCAAEITAGSNHEAIKQQRSVIPRMTFFSHLYRTFNPLWMYVSIMNAVRHVRWAELMLKSAFYLSHLLQFSRGFEQHTVGFVSSAVLTPWKVIKGHKRRTPELMEGGGASPLQVTMATVVPKELVMWYHHTYVMYVDIYILPNMFVTLWIMVLIIIMIIKTAVWKSIKTL